MNATQEVLRKEIWMIDFGTGLGSEQRGTRPCVIVSQNINNFYSSNITVVAITSKVKKKLPVHVTLSAEESNLPMDSIALVETIRSVSKERLIKKVGEINDDKMEEINTAIQIQTGLIEIPFRPPVRTAQPALAFA